MLKVLGEPDVQSFRVYSDSPGMSNILGVIFFVLITPTGIIRRLLGKDSLGLQFDKKATSYRKFVTAQSIQHMEKPF